jgi:hypothetical protein
MADIPRVTIVVSPRERFSLSERALASIYEHTQTPFRLIYVSGGTPEVMRRSLEREAAKKGFELIHTSRFLAPNQARNLAIPRVDTEFIAFLDNDALVAPHWLEHLLKCADDTGAWVVGPLYMIHEFERATIHMAGGRLWPEEENGKRYLVDEQYLYDTPIAKADMRLSRRQCEYVEFHCMLVRTEVFERIGPLDGELYNLHEERDFCLAAAQAGGDVFIEPKAVVTYVPPPPCEWWDLPYFMLRWSEEWSVSSVRLFNRKWDITGIRHISDRSRVYEEGTVIGFSNAWRSRVAGMRFSNVASDPIGPGDQSLLMAALLASVDRQRFAMSVANAAGDPVVDMTDSPISEIIQRLAALEDPDFAYRGTLLPLRRQGRDEPVLLRVDELSRVDCDQLAPLSFMVLRQGEDRFQAWFAAPARSWRQLTKSPDADSSPASLAGCLLDLGDGIVETSHTGRMRLQSGQVGRMLSEAELTSAHGARVLANAEAY